MMIEDSNMNLWSTVRLTSQLQTLKLLELQEAIAYVFRTRDLKEYRAMLKKALNPRACLRFLH